MCRRMKNTAKLANAWRQALFFSFFGPPNVSAATRFRIASRILRTHRQNPGRSASSFGEQMVLVDAILRLPPEIPGAIVEFGCFKGVSTVALSIAARQVGRRVIVFDSFEGLPEPQESVQHLAPGITVDYQKGAYA